MATDVLNREDLRAWVHGSANTYFGDADLDGEFNSSDFVQVFQTGKYETGRRMEGWSEGDWNGDGLFNSADFITAFQDGGYERGPRTDVTPVPELGGVVLLVLGPRGRGATKNDGTESRLTHVQKSGRYLGYRLLRASTVRRGRRIHRYLLRPCRRTTMAAVAVTFTHPHVAGAQAMPIRLQLFVVTLCLTLAAASHGPRRHLSLRHGRGDSGDGRDYAGAGGAAGPYGVGVCPTVGNGPHGFEFRLLEPHQRVSVSLDADECQPDGSQPHQCRVVCFHAH